MNGGKDADSKLIVTSDVLSHFDDAKTIKKAIHEQIEIKSFYAGASTLLIGSKSVNVKAGDVVVINPYEFHTTIDIGVETGKYNFLMIPLDYFSFMAAPGVNLRDFFFSDKKVFRTLFENDEELCMIVNRIAKECKMCEKAYELAVRGLMMQLFAVLIRRGVSSGENVPMTRNPAANYDLIEPAIRYIRDHFAEQIEVEHLAELCRLSKYYFCHTFKTVTDYPVMGYVRQYRLKIADVMLMNTTQSVEDIAEYCGFESANYFIRCYKKHFGKTPGKRRSHGGKPITIEYSVIKNKPDGAADGRT